MNSKKKKDDDFFSSLFSKNKKSDEKRVLPFDENYFTIEVVGGAIHTERIVVRGLSVVGAEEVKLKCHWFLISENNDITPLMKGET
jgi:hypothetical protein